MFVITDEKKRSWSLCTLIVPGVSVGNVGQLSADLLVSTLSMTRIGYLHDDSILPMVGNDPFAQTGSAEFKLVTSCEIFESSEKNLIIIQQRAPFVKGRRASFRRKLHQWIKECNFSQVIILTSTYSHERLDSQLQGSQLRFVASPKMNALIGSSIRERLKWQELERRQSFPAPSALEGRNGEGQIQGNIYIPGGGIAKQLFEDCYEDLPVLVVLIFCSEGDNIQDAIQLTNYINDQLNFIDFKSGEVAEQGRSLKSWKIPSSWKLTFGSKPDPTLFH